MRVLVVMSAALALAVLVAAGAASSDDPVAAGPLPADAVRAPGQTASGVPMPAGQPERAAAGTDERSDWALVQTYCAGCHSDRARAGGLSLAAFDPAKAAAAPDVAEKIVRKLAAGMMPPAGARRPAGADLVALQRRLEARLDRAAAARPNPGWRPFQRLTRAEYAAAIKDLLDLDIDPTRYLPPDTSSHGFDNVADAQSFSPALFEGYLRAAGQISRLAIGDRQASATSVTYRIPQFESQMRHVEGTPFGARGGLSVVHTFPADGTYVFQVIMVRTVSGELYGNTAIALAERREPVEILVNGERAAVLEVHAGMSDADQKAMTVESPPVHIKAGPQRIAVVFPRHFAGPVDDLLAPIDSTLIDTRIGTGFGVTALPHIQDVTIQGPLSVTGVSDTPSRRKVFTCRPTSAGEEEACAASIARRLVERAFRGTASPEDLQDAMRFYAEGRRGPAVTSTPGSELPAGSGGFEEGIRLMVQAILANPRFVFRAERAMPAPAGAFRVADVELASRLSFFLWGTGPDEALIDAARQGVLSTRAGLDQQVRRMLADPRSAALSTRFAAQWLRLQDVDKIRPDGLIYPYWDRSLSQALRRETELFFEHLVREDRSVRELLTADYSFVNERIARHYGIPGVTGEEFRRVALPATRRGLLGQGSILLLTSVADRTSPVQRGKWVMQVLLGSPPPPPPPNVPTLDETRDAEGTRVLSVRERMEVHRRNPACNSCHRVIDPLGLALENFDVTGRWRNFDRGVPVDPAGELYDGTAIDGPAGLRAALLAREEILWRTFTEHLMTYALGRQLRPVDMPAVRAIVRDAERQDYRMSAFIQGVVRSQAFRMMSAPPAAETAGADGLKPEA
jgi:mono/diheme cytochrome c family protein